MSDNGRWVISSEIVTCSNLPFRLGFLRVFVVVFAVVQFALPPAFRFRFVAIMLAILSKDWFLNVVNRRCSDNGLP
jgi:hypothetical protein